MADGCMATHQRAKMVVFMAFSAIFLRNVTVLFWAPMASSAACVATLCAHTAAKAKKVSVKKLIFTLKIWGDTFFFAKFVAVLL